MKDYLATGWEPVLRHCGIGDFEALWSLKTDWYEPPNLRRGGWSGVIRLTLEHSDRRAETVYIKRQENHTRRTLLHPLRGQPTFADELKNILTLQCAGVPTLEPIFYGQRRSRGRGWRAVLVTRELAGFSPLDELVARWQDAGWGRFRGIRRTIIRAIAKAVAELHRHHLMHNTLYPKHLFIRCPDAEEAEVRLIDVEKMRRNQDPLRAARRDLDSLNRRSFHWSRTDRLRFLLEYLGTESVNSEVRDLWKYLARRHRRFLERRTNG